MNAPLRRVTVAVLVLFGLLLVNINYLQVFAADELLDNPANSRILVQQYERERGEIVVENKAVAASRETDDRLEYLRIYPGGPPYAHITGFYSLVYGASGIERYADDALSGDVPELFLRRISDLITGHTPRGASVLLTVDRAAQEAAVQGLGDNRGAVVALDPRTGAILALASSPSYDPAVLSSHDPSAIRAAWERLTAAEHTPLLNRALRQTYPPGSTFKVITAAAALSTGEYEPSTQLPAPRVLELPLTTATLRNFGGEVCSATGTMTLADALRISCNTAFAQLGMDLGAPTLRAQARAFGFDSAVHVPMPTAPSRFPDDINAPQTAQSAIGQFDVRATPMQMAMVAAGLANDGVVMKPFLIDEVQAPDFTVLSQTEPDVLSTAVSPQVADTLTSMMVSVVQSGTGTVAQLPGITVAGKTGTAQHGAGEPPHAWFIAFAPAEDPQVAVAVLVEDGGGLGSEATGSRVAGPIAKSVMAAVLEGTS